MHFMSAILEMTTIEEEFTQLRNLWEKKLYVAARYRAIVIRAHIVAGGRRPQFPTLTDLDVDQMIRLVLRHTNAMMLYRSK